MCGGSVVEDVQTAVQAPINAQADLVSVVDPNAGSVTQSYNNSAFSPLSSVGVLTGEVSSDTQYRDDTVTAAPYVAAGTAAVAGGYALAGAGSSGAAAGSLAEGSYVAPTGTLGSGAFDYGAYAATAEAPVGYGLGGEAYALTGVGAANGAVGNAAAGAATGGSSWWQAPLIGAVTTVGTQAAISALSPKPSAASAQPVATARQPAVAPPVVNVGSSAPGMPKQDLLNNPVAVGAVVLGIAAVGLSMKKARR